MAIEQPLPARALFVGAGGMGMRGLAGLWRDAGVRVDSSDDNPAARADLIAADFEVIPAAAPVYGYDCLVYSDAVPDRHPLRRAAQQAGVPELPYHVALGHFSRRYRTVAITGTHGKSSTTALVAHLLVTAGLDPTVLVGAPIPAWGGSTYRSGRGNFFVVEADEYREHFLSLSWEAAVIVSIDFDHPDYFHSLEAVEQAYSRFLQLNPEGWAAVRKEVLSSHPDISWPAHTLVVADDPAKAEVPALPGAHMRRNATLAAAAAAWCGVSKPVIAAALASFTGLGRRFEQLGTCRGVPLISDYGHHPQEIAATLAGLHERYPSGRILVLWEPHTAERLHLFGDAFVKSLRTADGVVLLPTYQPTGRGNDDSAADNRVRKHVFSTLTSGGRAGWRCDTYASLPTLLRRLAPDFTAVICFSAGSADAKLRHLAETD
ncbi:MAG: hypothetical protein COT71_03890 [Candidatus Andersenbacteria bacterium CG10_big_fil_rev_8_21_14_0_10_54_11]|uniref:UDP-N-acetylmuramate--L-alanine ligase n=1 Tax=Candidatus Andersenbacteria bacterium CG10_big_fil_rev_8_21_14_0_10_54_11 TaxID=1974485 RepID=A0A2M6WYF4_9BACT|nr:MAG: hypothetical protein COT71_03890 [Candidatus Andersenbacteria bacterium CG10_big_fil_rev_8_21_14_0_10_54_11]